MDELSLSPKFERQDIKKDPLSAEQLEQLYRLTNSYEALFNRRAQLYKARNLKDRNLQEEDFRILLLEHYTFLKRPVIVAGNHIFIGSSSRVVSKAKEYLKEN